MATPINDYTDCVDQRAKKPDTVECCTYCGEPRAGKLACCGEVHFDMAQEDKGFTGLNLPIAWLDRNRNRLHAEDCTALAPSAHCSCGLHRVLSQLRQLRNDLDREAQRPGIMWANEP